MCKKTILFHYFSSSFSVMSENRCQKTVNRRRTDLEHTELKWVEFQSKHPRTGSLQT